MHLATPRTDRRPLLLRLTITAAIVAIGLLTPGASADAGVVISPRAIDHTYVGPLDVTISGLGSTGQTVVIEEFYDADASGTIGGADRLVRRLNVTDGAVVSIGGHRNPNIPGDEDGAADQQIQTRLHLGPSEVLGRIPGQYILRVSPAGRGGFAPVTALRSVTLHDFGGSGVSGQVVGGRPAVGQPGALAVILTAGDDNEFVGAVATDASGNFAMNLAPGEYVAVGLQAGFVFDLSTSSVFTVTSGAVTAGQTVTLVARERVISGSVRDAESLAGLPGVALLGGSVENAFLALASTDAAGNYSMDATAEPWELQIAEGGIPQLGVLGIRRTESGSGSVTGFNIDLPPVTALIYGSVRTPADVPVASVELSGQTNGLPDLRSDAISDVDGNYAIGVTIGAWRVRPTAPGFLAAEETVTVTNRDTAVAHDVVAHPITATLSGQIHDNLGAPVAFRRILARDPMLNGGDEINSWTTTDANGDFHLGVFGGGGSASKTWQLQSHGSDDEPEPYVSSNALVTVQDGVDQEGIVFLVHLVTAHLQGQVRDENGAPVGNISISANPGNGSYDALARADADGNFDLAVFGETWNLGLSNIGGLGLVPQSLTVPVTDGVDQTGLVFLAYHGDATIAGTVKDARNAPIAGVHVFGSTTNGGSTFSSSSITDGAGSYAFPVFSGTWSVGVDSNGLTAQGYQPVANQNAFVPAGTVTVDFVTTPSLVGDLTNDGAVSGADLGVLLGNWGTPGADLNGDGTTNGADLGLLLANWTG